MSIKKDVLLCRFDRGKILLLYLYPEMFVRVIRSVRFSVHENHLGDLVILSRSGVGPQTSYC